MKRVCLAAAVAAVGLAAGAVLAQVGPSPFAVGAESALATTQPTTLFNGWGLAPAGAQVHIASMPLKMALSPDGKTLAAVCAGLHPGLAVIDVAGKQLREFVPLPRAFNGVAFAKDGAKIYVTGGNSDALYVFDVAGGKATLAQTFNLAAPAKNDAGNFMAGIAVHPGNGKLYVCNEGKHEVWVVNPADGKVEQKLRTGDYPHSCVFGASPRHLLVSNWGDRSVSVIDTVTGEQIRRIAVGIRPNDMVTAPDGRVFVACAGDNTVHVIQTHGGKVGEDEKETTEAAPPPDNASEIITTSLYPSAPEGSTPDGVAVSPDGKVLFVANADNNDVVVVDIAKAGSSSVAGFVPTGWYPTAVAASGNQLLVANGKGIDNFHSNVGASGGRADGGRRVGGIRFTHPNGMMQGWVSVIDEPTQAELAKYTEQVKGNSPFTPQSFRRAARASDSIIPDRVGGDCPIKYVLYIIKENRTYDQVFGDMTDASGKAIGNGDPRLTMFGQDVTPNHHQLARDYVLLDNLYCNSEVSVDGHSWCDGAIATDYRQRAWTTSYTKHGNLRGNDDMDNPAGGYLWDLCRRNGVTFKTYGEMTRLVPSAERGTWSGGRDMKRVEGWIKDLHDAEQGGEPPRLAVMSLGEDHTHGTAPGDYAPTACVGSNDVALARIVEAASRSKFWNQMAIFVVEDDAQNGPDHVDSHRTVGLVISPWARRRVVDSTPYTQVSMIRTIELILGLPPMTQYDAGATPMFSVFGKSCNPVPYVPLQPKVDLLAKNTKKSPGAAESARMDFSDFDEAPEDALNRILWAATKGVDVPYPAPVHSALPLHASSRED